MILSLQLPQSMAYIYRNTRKLVTSYKGTAGHVSWGPKDCQNPIANLQKGQIVLFLPLTSRSTAIDLVQAYYYSASYITKFNQTLQCDKNLRFKFKTFSAVYHWFFWNNQHDQHLEALLAPRSHLFHVVFSHTSLLSPHSAFTRPLGSPMCAQHASSSVFVK